jgi:hypothetical protein
VSKEKKEVARIEANLRIVDLQTISESKTIINQDIHQDIQVTSDNDTTIAQPESQLVLSGQLSFFVVFCYPLLVITNLYHCTYALIPSWSVWWRIDCRLFKSTLPSSSSPLSPSPSPSLSPLSSLPSSLGSASHSSAPPQVESNSSITSSDFERALDTGTMKLLHKCFELLCSLLMPFGWVYVFYVGHIDKIMNPFFML